MIKIAFTLNFRDRSWMGGVNYFKNLFEALRNIHEPLETVALASNSANKEILAFVNADRTIISEVCDDSGWRWKLRRSMAIGIGRDLIMESFLRKHDITLLSHVGYLGRFANIPSLTWIPDFQEYYFPEFFSPKELEARARNNHQIVSNASSILLSSEHAREGLARISVEASEKAYVLPFVVALPSIKNILSPSALKAKYGIGGDYFFLPNQFWAHKNHQVVIKALGLLKREGHPIKVLTTGNLKDHRKPEHSEYLMRLIELEDVEDEFRLLGMIPSPDMVAMMFHSVAVINPSLFEGWSTTVEEAKGLGKTIVLSDIPVHREQAPEYGIYFMPHDHEHLAKILVDSMECYDPEVEITKQQKMEPQYRGRQLAFAKKYIEIVRDVTKTG